MQTSGEGEEGRGGMRLRREYSNFKAQQSYVKTRGCLKDKKNGARDKRGSWGRPGPWESEGPSIIP